MRGATKKQRLFAKYIATAGISDAACLIKAGYSPEHADSSAAHLKKHPKVIKLIEKYTADDTHKIVASRHELLDMLSATARGEETDVDMQGNPRPASLSTRLKAVELLNKMRGHEISRTVITGANNGPVQIEASRKRVTLAELLSGMSEEEGSKVIARFVTEPAALIGGKDGP